MLAGEGPRQFSFRLHSRLPVIVELFDDPAVARWTPLAYPLDRTAARNNLDQTRTRRAEGHGRNARVAYAVGAAQRRQGMIWRAVRLTTA